MDSDLPEFPYDLEELKYIETLLKKIPEYKMKLLELHDEIERVSQKAVEVGSLYNIQEVESLIYKAFYREAENRPFNSEESKKISRLRAEIVWEGMIFKRNIPCEVCGENRSIDKCHIIPAKLGGAKKDPNLIYLCPTHHRLFDRFMLSKSEWAQIDWNKKSEPSQEYIKNITLKAQEVFWEKIERKEYEGIKLYETNEKPFVSYALSKIGEIFISGRLVKRSNIYVMLNENIREIAKKSIPTLIEKGILLQIKDSSTNMLILGVDEYKVDDEIITEIWQKT